MRQARGPSGIRYAATCVVLCALLALSACTIPSRTAQGPQQAHRGTPNATAGTSLPFTEPTSTVGPDASAPTTVTFAVIGDYGTGDSAARAVARLVASWHPDFIVATGDDYYKKAGGTGLNRYRRSTGALYDAWVSRGAETTANAFFPALGNHDYTDAGLSNYLRYFRLPGPGASNSSGNERYYDTTLGMVHLFVLNSNAAEPNGISKTSRQAKWLQAALSASKAPWDVVVDHHPPYSSDSTHGSSKVMRWPFASWGAELVLSGHAHDYERIKRNGITYIVDGLGGASRYRFGPPLSGSQARFNSRHGALRAQASTSTIILEFYDVAGKRIDSVRLTKDR
jgi:hypothetical protein